VTWTSLLANKEAQKHKTSKKELGNMRALIARDLADASLAGLSADRRFATAYNAALQAANMAIACAGCRIVSRVGHHRVSLESTKLVLGKPRTSTPTIDRPLEAAYGVASKVMACNMLLEDAAEGIDAFLQKRPASWRGK
jgi:hypothetical protein